MTIYNSTFMTIYSSIEEDLNKFFPGFDLARLQCMKSYLEMWCREKEAEEDSEIESKSSEASPPSPLIGASNQSEEQPSIPSDQPPHLVPLPQGATLLEDQHVE